MIQVGMNGLDPIIFMGQWKRVMGKPKFKARHRGKLYFFASQANAELFEISPQRFLPQIDGYCPLTYALRGKKVLAPADFPSVVGDKLYFHSKPYYAWICKFCPFILSWAESRYEHISAEFAFEEAA